MQEPSLIDTWGESLPPVCPECGYDLSGQSRLKGASDQRCPDCGYRYLLGELQRNARDVKAALRQVDDINEHIHRGMILGFVGLIVLVALWPTTWFSGLGRFVAVLIGLGATGLGAQVVRIQRLPDWSRAYLPVQPQYTRAVVSIVVGVACILLAALLPPFR